MQKKRQTCLAPTFYQYFCKSKKAFLDLSIFGEKKQFDLERGLQCVTPSSPNVCIMSPLYKRHTAHCSQIRTKKYFRNDNTNKNTYTNTTNTNIYIITCLYKRHTAQECTKTRNANPRHDK